MTLADELDAVWQSEAAPQIAEAFFSDAYQLKRVSKTSDGRGGRSETWSVVQSGKCMLQTDTARSGEGVWGSVARTTTSYVALLPLDCDVSTVDRLVVNNREFDVIDVKRRGDWTVFVQAWIEERSE